MRALDVRILVTTNRASSDNWKRPEISNLGDEWWRLLANGKDLIQLLSSSGKEAVIRNAEKNLLIPLALTVSSLGHTKPLQSPFITV